MPRKSLPALGFLDFLGAFEQRQIQERMRSVRLRKGQTLIEYGSRSTEVFFLNEGELRVLLYSADGREVSVRSLKPGQMVGELAAIDGRPRSASVVAVCPSMVTVLKRDDFLQSIESSPSAALWLAGEFAGQIRSLTEKIFELSALNVRNRLHCELFRLATATGAAGNQRTLKPAPTHAEMANRIGTHREAVTRELRELSRRGIIAQSRRQLFIRDVAALALLVRRSSGAIVDVYSVSGPSSVPDSLTPI